MASKKYGRDLSTPLAPTYGGPGPITKKMAGKVTEIAAESNTKLKKKNKAAKKQKRKATAAKVAAGAAVVGGIIYDSIMSSRGDRSNPRYSKDPTK